MWENCKPVFVDIDPDYLTIDEKKIEKKITKKTSAILATHVFGNACNIESIQAISEKYNLKIIYDAAHCFGVKYKDKSIFEYGDIITCSFHATKIFHTGEGGMLFASDDKVLQDAYNAHNFGHYGPNAFYGVGINGKMSELSAALGLAVLPYFDQIISARKEIADYYSSNLNENIQTICIREGVKWNYSYFPVVFETEELLLEIMCELNRQSIFPRRYFYPSLNSLDFVNGNSCPIAESLASRILCLPLFVGLKMKSLNIILRTLNKILLNEKSNYH